MEKDDCVVLDTDVASDLFMEQVPPQLASALHGARTAITFITIGEMIVWAESNQWGRRKRQRLEHWLSTQDLVGYEEAAAWTWGHLTSAARRRGRTAPANDTWIASCCITSGLPLATLNKKDFVDFANHHGLALVGEPDKEA
jgi:predicted nucleic acid-binding protein